MNSVDAKIAFPLFWG